MSGAFVSPGSPTPVEANKELDQNLPHARSIYLCQLAEVVAPYILKVIKAMYAQSQAESGSRVTRRFQEKLNEIPQWNSAIVEGHASHMESKVPYLGDLITAAFVSYVKVMSSIKLKPGKPNIRLQLPTNGAFLHKAFTYIARDFYYNPELVKNIQHYQDQMPMYMAFDRAIRHMLPQKEILKAYLGNSVDDEHTVSPTLDHEDDEDIGTQFNPNPFNPNPSPSPTISSPVPVAAAAPVSISANPEVPGDSAPVAQVTECETKTISIPPDGAPKADHDVDDGDAAFSDADDEDADWKH
jgi:hypothetical protein